MSRTIAIQRRVYTRVVINCLSLLLFVCSLSDPAAATATSQSSGSECPDACVAVWLTTFHIAASIATSAGICLFTTCGDHEKYTLNGRLKIMAFGSGGAVLIGALGVTGVYYAQNQQPNSSLIWGAYTASLIGGAVLGIFIGELFVKPSKQTTLDIFVQPVTISYGRSTTQTDTIYGLRVSYNFEQSKADW